MYVSNACNAEWLEQQKKVTVPQFTHIAHKLNHT